MKNLPCSTAICAFTTILLTLTAPQTQGAVFSNGNFEDYSTPNVWSMDTGVAINHKDSLYVPVHGGIYALQITAASDGLPFRGAYQVVTDVAANSTWTFSGFAKNWANSELSPGSYGVAKIEFFGGGGAVFQTETPFAQTTSDTWVPFSVTGTAPIGATSVQFDLLLHQGTDASGNLFYDDVSVSVVPEVPGTALIGVGMLGAIIVTREWRRRVRPAGLSEPEAH